MASKFFLYPGKQRAVIYEGEITDFPLYPCHLHDDREDGLVRVILSVVECESLVVLHSGFWVHLAVIDQHSKELLIDSHPLPFPNYLERSLKERFPSTPLWSIF